MTRVDHLSKTLSDHSPLLIGLKARQDGNSHCFRFQNMWLLDDSFINMVHENWKAPLHPDDSICGMKRLWFKLKSTAALPTIVYWVKPIDNWVKINIDGSVKENSWGCGGIIRDSKVLFIVRLSGTARGNFLMFWLAMSLLLVGGPLRLRVATLCFWFFCGVPLWADLGKPHCLSHSCYRVFCCLEAGFSSVWVLWTAGLGRWTSVEFVVGVKLSGIGLVGGLMVIWLFCWVVLIASCVAGILCSVGCLVLYLGCFGLVWWTSGSVPVGCFGLDWWTSGPFLISFMVTAVMFCICGWGLRLGILIIAGRPLHLVGDLVDILLFKPAGFFGQQDVSDFGFLHGGHELNEIMLIGMLLLVSQNFRLDWFLWTSETDLMLNSISELQNMEKMLKEQKKNMEEIIAKAKAKALEQNAAWEQQNRPPYNFSPHHVMISDFIATPTSRNCQTRSNAEEATQAELRLGKGLLPSWMLNG
ncbi:hypothetical protein M5K25_019269 [Dendrobium thyrsiflorum]|uniref:Uncharacterized protein n=1 Tax=Dendrobium thyrsiflorum TaxID=117978 RepID=A0ABD0UEK5_DENTH